MQHLRKPTALCLALALLFTAVLPGEAAALTIKEEKELAEEFLQTVRDRYKIIEDPAISDYINRLGRGIVSELPPQPFDYHFYVIEQDTYNAFAGPAGHIFVFSGLFEALTHEGELAALLAHEIAHASCRHISKMIESSKKTSIGSLAGVIAGILIGLGGASSVGSAIAIGSMAAGESATLAYSREKEMQADQLGREYLQKAGYDLHSMLSLLKTIRTQEWFDTDQVPTYLRTHPATRDRLSYLATTLSSRPAPPPEKNHAFERAHTRLCALYGNPGEALVRYREKIESRQPATPMDHYGYGLALEREGNTAAAVEHVRKAYKAHPEDPFMAEDLGRLYFLNGSYEKALSMLKETTRQATTGPEGMHYLGRTQLALGQTAAATETFTELVEDYPDHLRGLYFLGKCYAEQNDPGHAHYYLGLYHKERKDRENAAFHFKLALKDLRDPEKIEKINKLLGKAE